MRTAFIPRFMQEGKHWYAVCGYSRLRWKVIGVVGQWPPAFRTEKLR